MAGLERCTALQELYLSHNGLKSLQVDLYYPACSVVEWASMTQWYCRDG